MGSTVCFLITVLYGTTLLEAALEVEKSLLTGDCLEYPMEEENRAQLKSFLPLNVRSCGPIVAVRRIFDIHVVKEGGK